MGRFSRLSLRRAGVCLLLSLGVFAPRAHAVHEVVLGFGALNLGGAVGKAEWTVGYLYPFKDWLQFGLQFNGYFQSQQEVAVNTLDIHLGATANYGGVADGFFLSLNFLLRTGGSSPVTTNASTGFGLSLYIGKHFYLVGPLSLRPNLGLVILSSGVQFQVIPLQIAFLL